MNWLTQLFRSKTALAFSLNGLAIIGFLTLRIMLPATAQRPTLSLPQPTNLSVANWLADRLADVTSLLVALLEALIR